MTYNTDETCRMPLAPQCLDDGICDRLSTLSTLGRIPIGMAPHTPCIPLLLDKWRSAIKGVATLRAKEMSYVPFRSARYNDLPFDRGLAGFAPWGEEFVEIKVAEETGVFIAILGFQA
jgi:hypothetical protein